MKIEKQKLVWFVRRYARLILMCFVLLGLSGYTLINHYKALNDQPVIQKNHFTKRYVLWRGWVSREVNRNQLLAVMQRAADAGYTGIVVDDYDAVYKWGVDSGTPTQIGYRKIVDDKATELGLTLIPSQNLMNGMYEGTTTALAEAFPVVDDVFQVKSSSATVVMNPIVTLSNGGFENWSGSNANQPLNYTVDAPGVVAFRESSSDFVRSGSSSIRFEDTKNNPNTHGHGRVIISGVDMLTVPEFRTYEVSLWLKTENLNQPGSMNFSATGYDADGTNGRTLYANRDAAMGVGTAVKSRQDWTQYKIVFNSLDKTKILIRFGSWPSSVSTATGKFWIDDLSIQEVGLRNVVRRDSLPLTVKSEDGSTTYTEGQDYNVASEKLNIPFGSTIQENQILKVSWYQYANMMSNSTMENVCHTEFWDKLNTDVSHLNTNYPSASGFFVGYDEWRMANWDPACKALNGGVEMTGGEYMGYAMQQTENVYKGIKPNADVFVWSDMYDPYHNAVPIYYAVNGSVENSWQGLSSDVIVMNWNSQQDIDSRTNETKQKSSMKFFANNHNHQLLSMSGLTATQTYLQTLGSIEAESGGISGVDGMMYTSWASNSDGIAGDYTSLEAMADLIKADGRWGELNVNTNPVKAFTYKNNINISGTKSADVVGIKVNGVAATLDNNANTWNINVDLVAGQNTFNIIGKDQSNNSSITTTVNIIRRKLADANNDLVIDDFDFTLLLYNWGLIAPDNIADFNEDGKVDDLDFTILLYWMR